MATDSMDNKEGSSELTGMSITARILAVLGAFALSYLLYHVGKSAWAYHTGVHPSIKRSRSWKWKARSQSEPEYQQLENEPDAEQEDEGYHDGESLPSAPFSPYLDSKPLPSKPLPDKPLPPIPRGARSGLT